MYAKVRFKGVYTSTEIAQIRRTINTEEDVRRFKVVEATDPWEITGERNLKIADEYYGFDVKIEDLLQHEIFRFEVVERIDRPFLKILSEIQDKIEKLTSYRLGGSEPTQVFNERCNVHVPGIGLLLLDEVKLLGDCCTDNLQGHLDEGWRIIAACPQPDQRRPDYILGRAKSKQ